ncbi:MAG: glycosyltransferase [Pseudomonadota bacterium]
MVNAFFLYHPQALILTAAAPIRILHLASSYPDPIGPDTCASSLLLEEARDFNHRVLSFKRAGWRGGIQSFGFSDAAGQDHTATAYGAPGKGLFFLRNLNRLADYFYTDQSLTSDHHDIVHGHKLTMDGYIASVIAQRSGRPFALTLQANTDSKIIRARPDLRPVFRQIWMRATAVFSFAPVASEAISNLLGARTGPTVLMPPPTRADAITAPTVLSPDHPPLITTVFNLDDFQNKNIDTLIRAVAQAGQTVPGLKLRIIGGGAPRSILAVSDMAQRLAPGQVELMGPKSQEEMPNLLNSTTAFALLSKRESFGMVFAEALLSGAPVLYPKGRAIDGYFQSDRFAQPADPNNLEDITRGLLTLCKAERSIKAELAQAQSHRALDFLRRSEIARVYQDTIKQAVCR